MAKKKTINMVKSQVIYKDYSKDAERTALVSGENLSHMFGKIARWYTDISWVGHTHTEANITDFGTYAGASTKGGAATSANKLNIGSSDIGSETKPVYFSYLTGKPVACTYSLNASVPANAVFTDINVKQSPSTADESREVLFAGNTGNTETTGTVGKSNKLYFNPSTGALTATSFSGSVAASNLTGTIDAGRLPTTTVTAGSYGPAAGGTLTYGGTFDVPYVTVDKYGRLTAGSTKTFTMPAQYTHPSYTSKTSGLYKITVDSLGHVSGTAAVTASDLPAHTHDYLPLSGGTISSSSFGPLVIKRTGSTNGAGIKFYNQNGSTDVMLGAIGMASSANGGLIRWTADLQTSYTVLDTGNFSISRSLTSGTKIATITVNGTATDLYCQTNTNTTYTIATGDSNGQIKVTPSSGSAYNVSVKGLGSAAYTASTDYATSSHTHNYAGSSTPGGPALSVSTKGGDVTIGTANSSTNDSGDIIFLYGNGSEKMRIWTNNDITTKQGPLFRVYSTSGTKLYDGTLVLGDGTGASGTWSITAASANKLNTNAGSATNPVYFSNGVPVACSYSLSRDILRDYTVTSSNTANYPYHLLCYMKDTSPGYKDFYAVFRVTAGFDGQISGVYEVTVRMNNGSAGSANLRLISGYPFRNGLGNVVMGYSTAGSNTYAYVFLVCGTYARTRVRIIHNGSFTFNDTNEVADTTSSDKKGSVNVYASLASAGTALVGGSFANTQTTLSVGNVASSLNNLSVGGQIDPVYFSNGVPVKCKTVGDNGYFTNVAIIGSDGVMEIGKYIDMHLSNGSSNDYDYRLTTTGTSSIEFDSREANNTLKLYAPSGYTRLSFQTAESNKAYTASGITVYPLTTSGSTMVVETGGNMIVGGGEAASALYTNDFDNCKTQEKESLYLAADASILFVSNTQTFANRTCMVWESLGCLRPLSNNTLSIGRADYYWNKAYIKLIYGGSNGPWIMGRDNAVVINNTVPAGDSYAPVIAVKTNLGSWTVGSLGSSAKNTENLYFSYTTDANYNAGTNASNNYYLSSSGWFSGTAAKADKWSTARTLTIGSTGKSVDGSGNVSWSLSEIGAAAASHTHSYIPLSGSSAITGQLSVSAANCFRACNGGYGVILRNDGSNFYFLLTDKKTDGSEKSGDNWNSLRPIYFNCSTGKVSMQNGLSVNDITTNGVYISSDGYGPLKIVRTTGSYSAGIKFYTRASASSGDTYLGSIAMNSANGGLIRYNTNETDSYLILDKGNTSVSRSLTSGTKIATITIGGTATDLYCQTNTNTTYTFATGDSNGQIKVTPSGGSAQNISVKGLGSAAYTASSDYALASHSHNLITRNDAITFGASRLQWFDLSGNGTVSASTPYNPGNDWFHHIMLNHGNGNGYYVDLAICFHSDLFYYKRISGGQIANASRNNGWVRIIDSSCIGDQTVAVANDCRTVVTTPSGQTEYALLFVADPSTSENNTLRKSPDIRINYFRGAANTEGIAELVLGNSTAYTSANNSTARIAFYNKNGYYSYLYGSPQSLSGIKYFLPQTLSGDTTLSGYYTAVFAWDNADTHTTKPWKRILYTKSTSAWDDRDCIFMISYGYVDYETVIAKAHLRTNGSIATDTYSLDILFETPGFNRDKFRIVYTNNSGNVVGEVWFKNDHGQYASWKVTILSSAWRTQTNDMPSWEVRNNTHTGSGEGYASYTTGTGNKGPTYRGHTHMKKANDYWGMMTPGGADNEWIRTSSLGIIPYQSGAAGSGHQSIGTSSWYFSHAYVDTFHGALSGNASTASKWATARTLTLTGSVTGSASIDGSGNVSLATTTNHTHSYLPLAGGTMTGDITFTAVTSASYPATSCKLYWTGSTDWAKIYYRVDASDAGRLVLDLGDDTNTRIDFAYNGTTKSYIDTSGNFSGNAATSTTATNANYVNIVASNEIRFNVSTKPSSATDIYIGYAWSDGTKDAKINRYKFQNGNGALTVVQASTFEASSSIILGTSSNQGAITLYNSNNKSFSIVASPNATAGGGITLPPTSGLMTDIVYKASSGTYGALGKVENTGCIASLTASDISSHTSRSSSTQSFGGTYTIGSTWYNMLSIRHRNGANDGGSYGFYIRNSLTSSSSLVYNQQYNSSSWRGEATIVDSLNVSSYAVPNTEAGMSAAINKLSTGDSNPQDNDYYIAQYAGGGTATTSYHRRKHSSLFGYINSKLYKILWSGSTSCTARSSTSITLTTAISANKYRFIKVVWNCGSYTGTSEFRADTLNVTNNIPSGSDATTTNMIQFKIASDGKSITVGPGTAAITVIQIAGVYPI